MALTVVKAQLGEDLYDNNSTTTMEINGVDFNPRQPSGIGSGSYTQSDIYLLNQATSFDCTSFQVGHECCIALIMLQNSSGTSRTGTYSMRWKKGTTTLFTASYSDTIADGYWVWAYSYIGIDYDEIFSNASDYKVEFIVDGTVQSTITFSITNLSIATTVRTAGYFRVEGSNIHYIDDVYNSSFIGYEHIIAHDGSTYGTGATSGYIRVDTSNHGRLYYTDSSGNIRRTHLADDGTGTNTGGGTELPITGGTAGYIRVSNNVSGTGSYGYLCFIGYDGKGYRIMNGKV